jgi:isopentenyl diphosphate isomerase/L-lactate dehydrogenase-like FMN-dependent dehydrogenase
MKNLSQRALNIADLRELARRRLPHGLFDFIDGGNEDDVALRNNRAALERIRLVPRVLNDISKRNPAITLFGKQQTMPIVVAPTGPLGHVWYRGEVEAARACAKAGVPFALSSAATTPMEEIVREGGRQWFQLYVRTDREGSLRVVDRAERAGVEALVFTVDSVVPVNRESNKRNGFTTPFRITPRNTLDVLMHPGWLAGVIGRHLITTGMPRYEAYVENGKDPGEQLAAKVLMDKDDTLDWDFLRALRKRWPRTLIVKGILDPRDAVLAADCGADGIIVSNHGGVTNDAAPAPIDMLPDIVAAVGKRVTVLVDSGFRRGTDVLKALALGADAVLIGRAMLYGTAAAGEAGAARALEIFRSEIHRMLGVLGCNSPAEIMRDHVRMASELGHPPAVQPMRFRGAAE